MATPAAVVAEAVALVNDWHARDADGGAPGAAPVDWPETG
jgi:hypothetical protein